MHATPSNVLRTNLTTQLPRRRLSQLTSGSDNARRPSAASPLLDGLESLGQLEEVVTTVKRWPFCLLGPLCFPAISAYAQNSSFSENIIKEMAKMFFFSNEHVYSAQAATKPCWVQSLVNSLMYSELSEL